MNDTVFASPPISLPKKPAKLLAVIWDRINICESQRIRVPANNGSYVSEIWSLRAFLFCRSLKTSVGLEKMVLQLKALATLTDHLGSIPSTQWQLTTHFQGIWHRLWLSWASGTHIYIHRGKNKLSSMSDYYWLDFDAGTFLFIW